ncbi:MAG: tyrosine-type recombinase/integrase [Eubacteriales bacterium]|nr:tyrosine-type recombinase/integrase [Eubacteriales bacterium]
MTIYKNLEAQFEKLFRHLKVGSFKTRERYAKAFKRFMVFLSEEYHLQKLSNISEKHILSYLEYMQKKGLAASTVKTELAAIRFFHDNMPYTRNELPSNKQLQLAKRTFGGVDRTWTNREFNIMVGIAIENNHNDFASIMTLARYAGLRLEECFRIDTNDARKALEEGRLYVKGKGGLTRYVPINESISVILRNTLRTTPIGQKLFVRPSDKTHLAMKRLQCFIAYHRKSFTDRRITFHGLRHTYAHEQYDKFIQHGYSDYKARKLVSELLGHHRDDVTRIYLASGDDDV